MSLLPIILWGILLYSGTTIAAPWRAIATNPTDKVRRGEVLEIPIRSLTGSSASVLSQWQVINETTQEELTTQTVDQDGDSLPDLILIQTDFEPLETKSFLMQPGPSTRTQDPAKITFGRFVPERLDDFAWENDLVAFRMYGPALAAEGGGSGLDCWLKRVTYPIINKWYDLALKGISYHQDHGEGYDPYHVGASRGCGGLSYGVGGAVISPGVYLRHRVITNGPLRTEFELTYKTNLPDGSTLEETKRIAIDLGSRLTRFDISLRGSSAIPHIDLLLGLTTHEGKAHVQLAPESGYISAWELIDDAYLGTGIVALPDSILRATEVRSSSRDQAHAYLYGRGLSPRPFRYYAGYGWAKAMEIVSEESWTRYLRDFAENLQSPISLTITDTLSQSL